MQQFDPNKIFQVNDENKKKTEHQDTTEEKPLEKKKTIRTDIKTQQNEVQGTKEWMEVK